MALTDALAPLRAHQGQRLTHGLDDAAVERLAKGHPDLVAVIEVAAAENRPGQVQMRLQPVGNTAADAGFTLRLPQQAFDASGLAPEHTVTVRQRAYGVEFANSQTQQAFFLVLNDAWLQELRNNPVSL